MRNLEATFKNMFVIKEIEKEVASKKPVMSKSQAIQDDLKNGIEVDREELIHNYGLTMDDYERSLERLNKEEMKRTSTQLPLKIKIAKVENSQKERIFFIDQ